MPAACPARQATTCPPLQLSPDLTKQCEGAWTGSGKGGHGELDFQDWALSHAAGALPRVSANPRQGGKTPGAQSLDLEQLGDMARRPVAALRMERFLASVAGPFWCELPGDLLSDPVRDVCFPGASLSFVRPPGFVVLLYLWHTEDFIWRVHTEALR